MSPEQLIYRLWAKTNEREGDVDGICPKWIHHPLPLHLLDVGCVAEAWLKQDSHLFDRFCAIWPEADPEALRCALVLTAAAHDLGKVYPAFQAKSEQGWAYGYGTSWTGSRPNGKGFDHGAGTARIFTTYDLFGPPEGMDPRWLLLLPLVRIGAAHHGTLYPDEDVDVDDRALAWPLRDLVPALLHELAHHFGPPPELPPDPPPAFLLLTAGFVSIADWFGSSTDSFPAVPDVASRSAADAYLGRHRANRTAELALRDAGMIADFRADRRFSELFGPVGAPWDPRPGFQAAACTVPFGASTEPEIAVVEAPMGLGKTEIALFLAARALRRGTVSGLYAALPTQATSNALYTRVEDFARRIKGDADLALVLAHSGKNYFRDYRRLRDETRRTVFDRQRRAERGDPAPPSEVSAPSWVQPSKRALLAPLGLGTIDQALLAAMGVKHGFVRLFGLARKVIILDEVHAYDVYMSALLEHLLAWLGALGAKIILLSATLPSGLRGRLLTAYGSAEAPASDAYPQLLHGIGREPIATVTCPAPEATTQTFVSIESIEVPGDARARMAEGIVWLQAKVRQGGCVAWIRNTVREAQDAYKALRAAGVEADLLHARFVRYDRNRKEEALLERFGKPAPDNPKRPAARVVVATQVMEQSVDVDFDVMLSDLAPVDLLLQRAGRLHRHDRVGRRQGHDSPVLGILMPDIGARHQLDFGLSAYVYDPEILARSAHLVLGSRAWMLPSACRSLVTALYDQDASFWTAERLGVCSEALARARERHAARRATMEHAALRTLLTAPDQFPVMRDPRNDRSDAGEYVALTTRYGAHSAAAVLFRDKPEGPVPIGAAAPMSVHDENDWRARLDKEEAVAMASVSFPWFGPRPAKNAPSPPLALLYQWWHETHPYDDRIFLLLTEDGSFQHESFEGRYDEEIGLTVARTATTQLAREPVPLEDL